MAPEIPGGACPHLRAPVSQPVLPGAAGPWWPSPSSPRSAECHPTLPAGPVPGEGGPAPAAGAGESLGRGHGGRAGLRPLWTQTTTAATRRLIQGFGWVPAFCQALCSGLRTQAGQVETPTGDHRQCPERETRWVLCSLCWRLSGPRSVPERGPLHAIQELMDEEMGWVSSQNSACRRWEPLGCRKPQASGSAGKGAFGGLGPWSPSSAGSKAPGSGVVAGVGWGVGTSDQRPQAPTLRASPATSGLGRPVCSPPG